MTSSQDMADVTGTLLDDELSVEHEMQDVLDKKPLSGPTGRELRTVGMGAVKRWKKEVKSLRGHIAQNQPIASNNSPSSAEIQDVLDNKHLSRSSGDDLTVVPKDVLRDWKDEINRLSQQAARCTGPDAAIPLDRVDFS